MSDNGEPVSQSRRPHGKPTEDRKLLRRAPFADSSFQDTDAWRALRIMGEFVEGFDSLAELGSAVTIFGSARTNQGHHYAAAAEDLAGKLATRARATTEQEVSANLRRTMGAERRGDSTQLRLQRRDARNGRGDGMVLEEIDQAIEGFETTNMGDIHISYFLWCPELPRKLWRSVRVVSDSPSTL